MVMTSISAPQCAYCGTTNRPEARFCYQCGRALAPLVNGLNPALTPTMPLPLFPPKGITLRYGFQSDRGRERQNHEDSLITVQLTGMVEGFIPVTLGLFAVADGIGGSEAGEIASRMALYYLSWEIVERAFKRVTVSANHSPYHLDRRLNTGWLERTLKASIVRVNQALYQMRQQRGNNMGTTLTAVLSLNEYAAAANVGDSRTYLWRQGQLQQLTTDHSLVAALMAAGEITDEESLYNHTQKGIIYRSLGERENVEVDTHHLQLQTGDALVLCCDGLWEMIRPTGIATILGYETDPQRACDEMVYRANLAGGKDNISVVVVAVS